MAQPDPSSSVPQDLMPHVHLVSSFRYAAMAGLDLKDVAKWLMNAPLVARDKAPFFWTYLDKPADGTILLTWQPLGRLGTNFATDGFVWAPPEQIYKHDLGNGLMLEIYYLKAGYIPGEQFASHARRRFRLVPIPGHPNPPQPDVSLFIVHYGPSEPNDRIPANMIPYDERVNAIMQQRHFLQRAGQIRRKEFMLSDRVSWPSLPELTRHQMAPQMTPRGVPQQMAYPAQPPAGPPAKRARHAASRDQAAPPPGAVVAAVDPFDDEEDISRGDMFDHLTPREVSYSRYQQNHEWMEELLSSPYRMGQITPADLGIGLKGELASLTEGIFAAQGTDVFSQPPNKVYVGKLDEGEADKFRQRVNEYIASTSSDIEKIKAEHAKTLEEFKESSWIRTKERELRAIQEETGPEIWRVEGRVDATDENDGSRNQSKQTIDDLVKDVESNLGKGIERKPRIHRVEAGGYQEPAPEPVAPPAEEEDDDQPSPHPSQAGSQRSELMMDEGDMDMGDTAAGLLDQMHTGFSSTSTPNNNNFPTPQAHMSANQSGAVTPSHGSGNAASPAPAPTAGIAVAQASSAADVQMGGTDLHAKPQSEGEGDQDQNQNQGTNDGDWVVVPKAGEGTDPSAAGTPTDAKLAGGADEATKQQQQQQAAPMSTNVTPAAATPAVTEGGSTSFDQNDFGSLEDLDTAGDALDGYDGGGDDGALDLQMDMEDSAFGDAFHGVGSGTPGGEQQEM